MKQYPIYRGDTVISYKNLRDLFDDEMPEFLENLTEDEEIGIDHALDFENYEFLVINGDTVVVIMDGSVTSIHPIHSFAEITKELINED